MYNNVIWFFDKSGNLISSINPQTIIGRPIKKISEISVIDKSHLAILDGETGMVFSFDILGKYTFEFHVPFSFAELIVTNEKKFIFLKGRYNPKNLSSKYQIVVTNLKGEIIDEFLPYSNSFTDWITCGNQVSRYGNSLLINSTFENMIYQYNSEGKLLPFVNIDFEHNNLDTTNISDIHSTDLIRNTRKNRNSPLSGGSILPLEDGIYLWNRFNKQGFLIKLDMENLKSKVFKAKNHRILGEYYGTTIPIPIGIFNDKFVGYQVNDYNMAQNNTPIQENLLPQAEYSKTSKLSLFVVLYLIDM